MTDTETQEPVFKPDDGRYADAPLNVRCALALGWREILSGGWHLGWHNAKGKTAVREPGWLGVPDFAADPAWVLRVIRKNMLSVAWLGVGLPKCPSVSASYPERNGRWDNHGRGNTLGEAVCRWVVAARSAGIEVKQ